ncbi:hypothetical protein RI844_03265 [Thalassotalea fonticola]|uniref:Uncharacterized protein n=1 Tax=Thalassotalea fonticola TaxID=3065649 RepID=A0ABZ0GRI0_9GAMM|nr:hypothetical protein RI844_03265 [Colwelliaceae bacterium S1-1]
MFDLSLTQTFEVAITKPISVNTSRQHQALIRGFDMNVLTKDEKSDTSRMRFDIDQQVIFARIRTLMKITITLLIVIGFLNTTMSSSDIFFTLASMLWLWQQPLEKMELSIFNRVLNLVNQGKKNKCSDLMDNLQSKS